MKKLMQKLRCKRGDVLLWGMIWLLILFMIFVALMEFTRIQLISTGVRDAVEQAVTSVAINNAYNSYNGVREGNSGAYQLASSDWRENISTIDVQNKLVTLLHLKHKNGVFISPNPEGDSYEFKISNLNVVPDNAEFASNDKKAKYVATCDVEIPFSLGVGAVEAEPVVIHMRHQAIYVALFE